MIGSLTVGQIAAELAFIVALIGSIAYLKKHLKEWVSGAVRDDMKELDGRITALSEKIDKVDLENCKNFLVQFLADVEKGEPIDEIEKERFFEEYQHYIETGGNSYIKHKVETLKTTGKL